MRALRWALVFMLAAAPLAAADAEAMAAALLAETGAPGVAVALIDGADQAVAVAGERVAGLGERVLRDDPWHIGSVTKPMTAILAARLVAAGKIGWEETVAGRLGATVAGIDPGYGSVTLADLLRHRGGVPANLPRLTELALRWQSGGSIARGDYVAAILAQPPQTPGAYRYSNAGYVVAGAMLEAAAGVAWETALAREVLTPLGLRSAGFGPTPPAAPQGHTAARVPRPGIDNIPALGPAGRVHLSAPDMLRWLAAVLARDPFLPPEAWDTLLTPRPGETYAAGWEVGADGTLGHVGSNTLWLTAVWIWPERDRALALFSNWGAMADQEAAFAAMARRFRDAP